VPTDPTIAFSILKCRDLVQLYYGARLVASVIENTFALATNAQQLLFGQDPRRIKYEIIVQNLQTTAADIEMGTPSADDASTDQFYAILPGNSLVVSRDFLTDLDSVCLAIELFNNGVPVIVSTRETFLTPAPVDEGP
jgi:hypothetical protein